MNTNIKAVIFDMDGVLIDARDWHYEALNQALALFGMAIARHEHLSKFDGLPTRDKLAILTAEKGFPTALHGFINQLKQKYTLDIVFRHCKPVFQHEFALSELRKEGYRLAVASNSIRDSIEIMLSRANLLDKLEFFLSNQDVVQGKPSPEIYQKAISRLGLLPEQCLVIEDNENGLRAAKESGARVMKVESVNDVNYTNIRQYIDRIEGKKG
ncbi:MULTISPECIES: HAD family hydrolase [Tatumella]|uniref:Haloacid dehalogenase family protein n=1 Tax=Tatumella ptyseos ATCC 33301 TaxID=1005995 RepID=A0A085J997_9GAMM|nr:MULTISPECIES: HAD family phosphatase [Tatumella]KFD17043.1 haloacid dehalogenase family protein [Tatumella ptyseos ATCC 33301]